MCEILALVSLFFSSSSLTHLDTFIYFLHTYILLHFINECMHLLGLKCMKKLFRFLEGAIELGGVTNNHGNDSINTMKNKMLIIEG